MSDATPVLVGLRNVVPVIGCTLMEGVTGNGEPLLVIAQENPDRVPGFPSEGVSKETLERFHLASYYADYVLRHGAEPFERARRGDDPPDFVVLATAGELGVDLAALADEHRRLAHRLLAHFRERLLSTAGTHDFSGIGGCLVSVWFGQRLTDLPPKRWDDSIIEPLLDELATARVDRAALARLQEEIAQRGFPETFPPVVATGRIADDAAGFVANVVAPEGTVFPNGLPFEVQLHRPRDTTARELVRKLLEVVESHDKPAIEHLLLTAGAPDRSGWHYPAEEAVARFIAKQPDLVVRTRFIRRVTVHSWFDHVIDELVVEPTPGRDVPNAGS